MAGPKAKTILHTWSASTLRALAAAHWPPVAGPKAKTILNTWLGGKEGAATRDPLRQNGDGSSALPPKDADDDGYA